MEGCKDWLLGVRRRALEVLQKASPSPETEARICNLLKDLCNKIQ